MVLPLAVYLAANATLHGIMLNYGRDDYIKGGVSDVGPFVDPTLRRAGNVAVRNSLMLLPLGFIAANVGLVSKDSTFRYEAIALGAPWMRQLLCSVTKLLTLQAYCKDVLQVLGVFTLVSNGALHQESTALLQQ